METRDPEKYKEYTHQRNNTYTDHILEKTKKTWESQWTVILVSNTI